MTRVRAWLRGLHVSWVTVTLIAVVVAFADGFWMVSLERTVGAIERRQPPFQLWLRTSTLMVPLFICAVVCALALTRRSVAADRRPMTKLAVSALVIIAATFFTGMATVAANSGYDYYLQVHHLEDSAHLKHPTYLIENGTPVRVGSGSCDATCVGKAATRAMHLRGLGLTAGGLLVTNTVLVLWSLALCGGRLWVPRRAGRAPSADQAAVPVMA